MKSEISQITRELGKELIKIDDDKNFVESVLTFAFEEDDRKELLDFIRSHPKESTATEISLRALDLHKKRKR